MDISDNKYLSSICKQKHEWESSGKSLRYKLYGNCVICKQKYNQLPKRKEYRDRPDNKKLKRECQIKYYRDTENKKHHKEYMKEWEQRPGNKKRRKENADKLRRENPEKAREKNRKRRALKSKAFVEGVDLINIFERDKGKCQLCGIKLTLKTKWPNKLFAILDHIVPLSKGGEHSRKNVQLACRRCNSEKKNGYTKNGEQLRLFG